MKTLGVAEVEGLPFLIARELRPYHEPIPDFSTRYPGILESCLAAPFQTFDRKSLYHGLIAKAAVLFYLLIKNHPFLNGNKRIAVTTLFVFLALNDKWLRFDQEDLYRVSMLAAESKPQYKNEVVRYIEKYIRLNLVSEKGG